MSVPYQQVVDLSMCLSALGLSLAIFTCMCVFLAQSLNKIK